MIFRGRHYRSGDVLDVIVEEGRIVAVDAAGKRRADHGDASMMLSPGMADIQVNGFGGKDFLQPNLTVDDVRFISRAVLKTGVTRYCPTLITNEQSAMVHQARTIARACEQDALTGAMSLGLHVEGPFLSPVDGPRGAHPLEFVRDPSWREFMEIYDAAGGRVRILTIAPELVGALDVIERVAGLGITVAAGHHQAGGEILDAAVRAGVKMCTHLGNGSHATMHRLSNYIWEQLGDDRLWASFIPDGHHIPPATLRCMLRAKGVSRTVVVTDATACAGRKPGEYEFLGAKVTLHEDGRLCLAGTPYFAGSALDMPRGIEVVVRHTDLDLADALDLVVVQPFRLFGEEEDRLSAGRPVDLMLFTWAESGPRMDVKVVARGDVVIVND